MSKRSLGTWSPAHRGPRNLRRTYQLPHHLRTEVTS